MFPDPDAVCGSPMAFTGDMGMHPGTVRLPIV